MISSGCSEAIAARTACSTSAASRTFRISTTFRLALTRRQEHPRPSQPPPHSPSLLKAWTPDTRAAMAEGRGPFFVLARRQPFLIPPLRTTLHKRFDLDRSVTPTVRLVSNYIVL